MGENVRIQKVRPASTNFSFDPGKLPPQALDMEEGVLGALMLENCIEEVVSFLTPQDFYKEIHGIIYQAILELFKNREPVDIMTVSDQLRKMGQLDIVGGPYNISQLTNKVSTATAIEYHARVVHEKFLEREIIRIASEMIKNAYDETVSVLDLIDNSNASFYEIAKILDEGHETTLETIVNETRTEIVNTKENVLSGIDTGFKHLNKLIGGWQNSDMIILGARPGMGKTAFLICTALNAALKDDVAIFSLEMSSRQLMKRIFAVITEIDLSKMKFGLNHDELKVLDDQIKIILNSKLHLFDEIFSIDKIYLKCKKLFKEKKLKMIVIDYLQLIDNKEKSGNREQEVSKISRSIKRMAKEFNVPIIVLSQLSRQVETRGGDKRPILADLRESGSLEQDTDIVGFLYRPEYYNIDKDADGNALPKGYTELIIAKHRNGSLETLPLEYVGRLTKFKDFNSESDKDFMIKPNEDFLNPNQFHESKPNDQCYF